jgi:hypothetical protein
VTEDFISEDDLLTFEGFLRYQCINPDAVPADELKAWRRRFDELVEQITTGPKVGRLKLRALLPDEKRYAIAIQDGADLWLTMWVRCSPKGEIFIMYPRGDRKLDAHASYHLDGSLHQKSDGVVSGMTIRRRQPLTGTFTGTEHLGAYGGHGWKSTGAVCDPALFTGVVVVGPGRLGPRDGAVAVDLVEPGCERAPVHDDRIIRQVFPRSGRPSIVITIASTALQATDPDITV